MDTDVEKFPEIFRTYNAKLRQMQMIDYDDQMIYASEFWNSILRYLHISGSSIGISVWTKRRILRKYSMI